MIVMTEKVTFVGATRAKTLGHKGVGDSGGYLNLICRYQGQFIRINLEPYLKKKILVDLPISIRNKINATMPMQADITPAQNGNGQYTLNADYPPVKVWLEKIRTLI